MQKYSYINIGGKYFCQQQSVIKLVGLYLFNRDSCPDFIDPGLLLRLFLFKIKIRKYPVKLELPVFGAWCLRIRCGYKVFDPYRKTATKIFDANIDSDLVRDEIRQHRKIGESNFAPTVISWNEDERWYQEEYLSGQSSYYFSPDSSSKFMRIYCSDVAPVLVKLMMFRGHKTIKVKEYIEGMNVKIEEDLKVLYEKSPDISRSIQEFFNHVSAKVDKQGDKQICLVFSHGDFHLYNLFKTESGLKLIDWEGIGEQSLMYDCYNYFFSHLWLGRTRNDFVSEMRQAVIDMTERLENINSELAVSLSENSQLYRLLFYIERIYAMSTIFKSHPESYLKWINVYRNFEEKQEILM